MEKIRKLKRTSTFSDWGGSVFIKKFRLVSFSFIYMTMSGLPAAASEGEKYNEKDFYYTNRIFSETRFDIATQQITISGSVRDKADKALAGVTVKVKSTNQVTTTNKDGVYTLADVSEDATLIFSFVGMKTTEVAVSGQSNIDVVLEEDLVNLEETVVIGYTKRAKGELTGSVSTVNAEELQKSSNTNVAKALSGRVPGLIVVDRGGTPGSNDVTLLIRGKSTLNDNSPLIVVDGVPTGNFSFLAPGDIASITVLKDAAAAIYGAQAANGVILVTTNRGKSGKPKFNFSSSYRRSTFARVPDMMDSYQYATYRNEADQRYNNPLIFSNEAIDKYKSGIDPINYPNTDWYGLTMKDWATENRNSLSVSGGNESVKYFISGDALNEGGMYASGDLSFKQYQIRSNLDFKLHQYVKLGVDLYALNGKRLEPGVNKLFIHKQLQVTLPTQVGEYPNGLYGVAAENGANPRVMASNQSGFNDVRNTEFRPRFTVDVDLGWITKGLAARGIATYTSRNTDGKLFRKPWTVYNFDQTSGEYNAINGFNFETGNFLSVEDSYIKFNEEYYNGQLTYDRVFNKHTIRGFVAFEQREGRSRSFEAYKRGLISEEHPELFAGSDVGQRSSGVAAEWGRLNYFGTVGYDYKKKYLLDFTLRYDGSSNFAEGKRFGTFPGVSAGWVISSEDFMEGTANWLNLLKLRASWAKMGNDRVPGYQYLTKFTFGGSQGAINRNYYIFGESPVQYNSFFNTNVPNPDITWELAYSKNVGLNFTMFNNKLSGDVNYFFQKRTNILVTRNASVPVYTALQLPQENIGKVDNYGFEFELGYQDRITEKLSYNLNANMTLAKNKVVYLDEAANVPEWRKREGHPMDSYLIYPTDGLFKTQEDVDKTEAKIPGTKPGDVKYLDTDGDGKITGTDMIRKYTSNVPQIQFGVSGGARFQNFELNFLFQGQAKAEIEVFYDNEGNRPTFEFEQRWTPENPNARYPRAFVLNDTYNAKPSDIWLRDASFVRLKELEMAYNFATKTTRFADIRVFVRGSNLFTWDKLKDLKGFDPEMSGYRNFTDGLYSPLKTLTAGLNLQF